MKKCLIALLLCLVLALPIAVGAEETAQYYYPAETINANLFIATSWESLATEEACVYPYETHVTDDTGAVVAGACVFHYLDDEQAMQDWEYAQTALAESGVGLAGVVMYPAGGAAEDAGLVGYSYRTVYEGEEFCLAAAWRELSDIELPEGAPAEALEAVVASFRDTDEYIVVNIPPDSLGHFQTTDLYGAEYTSDTVFSGEAKLTLVNVWATYCQPCLVEMPYLGELAQEYADKGVQIIGIPVDIFDSAGNVDEDQIELARRYAESTGAAYPHLIPDTEMQANLLREVYYVPNSWFFDSEGKLIGEALVGSYSKEDWAAQIDAHLALVNQAAD